MSSTDFSRFVNLPAEVRLQVWGWAARNALNPPRAIIEWRNGPRRTIAVLNTSLEAREEAMAQTDLRSVLRYSLPEDPVHLNRLGLSLEDREEYVRHSPRDWYSLETDVFVLGANDRILRSLCYDITFRNAIKTIAIPAFVLDCDGRVIIRQLRWESRYMNIYQGLKTVVLLRDDPAQEPISHRNLIQNRLFYPRTNDIRIKIEDSPLSQVELDLLGFDVNFFNNLVISMRSNMTPDWQLPEIKWGCLVRY
ncbi:uncharacterized protein EAF02_008285 [Botrytis sinoallii]|uniref:uncharacterized protein n=1 Tax=Botrytis sinoallii TaxID=1463999 RepID=UPI001901D54A|nr:uncharacterized protein EAF02_008285 [Botrytis sinoallii]KAF7877065.1 hypothetical protein EAF02_008285 [Botrytis sinoallii]